MIPYALIMTSASRPHLLKPTLESLFAHLDQMPLRVLVHDDVLDREKNRGIQEALLGLTKGVYHGYQLALHHADPPRRLGLAINWLLANIGSETEYVLYSQDDFVTVRDIPLRRALQVMHDHNLHHIRFNKRATMAFKETWAGRWVKEERTFLMGAPTLKIPEVLTISDHWYFQLGLWRVSEMRKALSFWTANPERTRRLALDEPEGMINHYFDHIAYGGDYTDQANRAQCQKTFIWGPIGEDRYIRHIGGDREDWAGTHPRSGGVDSQLQAWAEIAEHRKQEKP